MKITLIIIGVIAIGCFALEIASKISAKRDKPPVTGGSLQITLFHHFLGCRGESKTGLL